MSVSEASSKLRLRDGFIFSKGGCSPCWKDKEAAVSLQAKLTFKIYFGNKRKLKIIFSLFREINKKGVSVQGLKHMKYKEGIARLTGLKVSRPKLPLLFRLPISVWELDWDIPSKNGLLGRHRKNSNMQLYSPQKVTYSNNKIFVFGILMFCDSKTFQNICFFKQLTGDDILEILLSPVHVNFTLRVQYTNAPTR